MKRYINNSRGRATVEKPASVCLTWCSVIHQVLVWFVSFEARSPGASELPLESTHQPANTTRWGWICHSKWHHWVRKIPRQGGLLIYKPSAKLLSDELQLPPWESPSSSSVCRTRSRWQMDAVWDLCWAGLALLHEWFSERLQHKWASLQTWWPSKEIFTSFCFFPETPKSRALF